MLKTAAGIERSSWGNKVGRFAPSEKANPIARDHPPPKNGKGCDIGYALAANSCEGANSMEARTVTALDAITAFAVPNPNCSSQKQSVFSGLVALQVALRADHSAYFGLAKFISPILSAVDADQAK